jgi:E3 ubiquitin-protein ligase HUWE1
LLSEGSEGQAPEKNLQTMLLNRFKLKGGLDALIDILNKLTDELPNCDKDDPQQKELAVSVPGNLKRCFTVIRLFTIGSHISESPQTGFLSSRDRYKDQGHYFLLSSFLTESRAAILPALTRVLSHINKLDKNTTHYLLLILCEVILGGPEEYHSEANKYEGEPDEESINRLCQLGFDRALVYSALMTHGNIEEIAKDYLLSRREARNAAQSKGSMPPLVESDLAEQSEPTEMEVDPPSGNPGTSSSASESVKPEFKETAMETLARLRTAFSDELENYITDILIYHPDLTFELSRLIKSVGKWESKDWLQDKLLELAARLASLEDDKTSKSKEISACAHVLGLLLSDPRYYKSVESTILAFLDSFVGFLNVEPGQDAPWLGPVSLIVETIMREVEYVQMRHQAAGLPPDEAVPEIKPQFYESLLRNLVSILESNSDSEKVVLCVLRLLFRLTREGQWARLFRELDGISSLLKVAHRHAGKPSLKISDPVIIIIRNIVEDDKIVLATMRSAVQYALDHSAQRGRPVDLSELVRSKHAEVLRNPTLFSYAVEQIGKLTQWSSTAPTIRKLTKKQTEAAKQASNSGIKDLNVDGKEGKPAAPETPRKSTLELNYSTGVVQTLLTELLARQSESISKEPSSTSTNISSSKTTESPDGDDTSTTSTRSKLSPEEIKEYAYTLFLLQTLSELLGSYNNCKLEFVNYSRRGQPREPLTPSKPRSMMLNYLLNDLVPMGGASYINHGWGDLNLEKRRGISALAASVISSLCKKTPEFYEHDERPDLLSTVRKFVLEGIARSFKDTLASIGPAQLRYSRFTALAELCRRLLLSQPPLTLAALHADVAGTADIAKLMFEKGFVGLLTNVVADIELDFPEVRIVVNDILACLRDLTASVNRLAANSAIEVGNALGDADEISIASSASEEEMQDRDETPDVFQNSALGILQGVVEDNDEHEEYDEYDEEMDYDDEDDEDEDDGGLNRSGSESEDDDDDDMDEDQHDMHVIP